MIIGDGIVLGAGGETASIFVTGLSQNDTVTCTKDGKSYKGKWKSQSTIIPNVPLIPNMTSNTAPSGVASTNKTKEGSPYNSFDGNESTYFYGGDYATLPWYVQYEFDDIVSFDSFFYKVSTPTGDDGAYTAGHSVQISLDGSSWETIWSGSSSNGANNPERNTIHLSETKRCKFIRWNTTSMSYWSSPTQCLWEFQVYGSQEDVVEGYEFTVNDYGTYTITATDGTRTTTQDVLVDTSTEYEIVMSLTKLWLYRDGNECEDITGGWSFEYKPVNYGGVNVHTNNILQMLSNYSKLYVDVEVTQGIVDGNGYLSFNPSGTLGYFKTLGRATYEYNLSDFEYSAYPLRFSTGGGQAGSIGTTLIAEKQDNLMKILYDVSGDNRKILIYRVWAE